MRNIQNSIRILTAPQTLAIALPDPEVTRSTRPLLDDAHEPISPDELPAVESVQNAPEDATSYQLEAQTPSLC